MSCWFVAATVLIGVLKSPVVDSCSMPVGWRPPTTEELIEGASEVLFAVVRGTFPDTSGRPWSKNLYTAEVAVFCIMKGQQTPPVLNITDVGLYLATYKIVNRNITDAHRPEIVV